MPEREGNGSEDKANWKAPEEGQEAPEAKVEGDEEQESGVKFDPNRRPGIPRGARFKKGKTVFHQMAELWDDAKAYHDHIESRTIPPETPDDNPISRYERFSDYVGRWYGMLTEAGRAGDAAMESAGLTLATPEGQKAYNDAREKYIEEHHEEPPTWVNERWPKKEKK